MTKLFVVWSNFGMCVNDKLLLIPNFDSCDKFTMYAVLSWFTLFWRKIHFVAIYALLCGAKNNPKILSVEQKWQIWCTRSLAGGPSGLLDFVLHALRALRPCDPRLHPSQANTITRANTSFFSFFFIFFHFFFFIFLIFFHFCIQILFWWWWWRSGGRKQRGC